MLCAHSESRGLECSFIRCPRSGAEIDWKEFTDPEMGGHLCPFRRSDKWQPQTNVKEPIKGER